MIKGKFSKAFTLIELMVVIAIIGLLGSIVLVNLRPIRERGRDGKRIVDISQIIKASQLYWLDYGRYSVQTPPLKGGWEASDLGVQGDFMEYLKPYFSGNDTPVDPVNKRIEEFTYFGPRPGNYFYAYARYDAPMKNDKYYCQCDISSPTCTNINRPFAVIAISKLESYIPSHLPEEGMPLPLEINLLRVICGDPGPDEICTVDEYKDGQCRDWSQEFDYSRMLTE